MLIKTRQGWELPERLVTPEELVMNRRHLLRGAGAVAVAGALTGCDRGTEAQNATAADQAAAAAPDPSLSLYPFKRNASYTVDRAITSENIVTSYNNYYEFGVEKDDPVRNADRLPIRPWEVSFEGMVEKPFKTEF